MLWVFDHMRAPGVRKKEHDLRLQTKTMTCVHSARGARTGARNMFSLIRT